MTQEQEYEIAEQALDRAVASNGYKPTQNATDTLANLIDPLPRMRSLELALDSMGQALVILCRNGKIVYASPHAFRILADNDGLLLADEIFRASLDEDQAHLAAALDHLLENAQASSAKQELSIRRPTGKLPYKLRVNALPETQQALIIIHDTHANHMAWYDRLQARFQLTPRECECTMLLTDGYSMAEIAERMKVSMQTLRQHLKHAFNKTGTHKQHELVGIVLQMQRKR